jgi:hypothetical protein
MDAMHYQGFPDIPLEILNKNEWISDNLLKD